ncbi:MAG: FHA domain-containing protein [Lentisphaerae bacterium]|jgi:pSer/pThr/pTyr-binding forkhead associated (FHA) protein|nr:FHA domain-containing protein [Lentisphaerota bacterium]MBT4820793.1 FHA domain-containing protein [Lentisphaerota bacterium]MBT5610162.1 FHA domain-containing protein [Lentisphaerota bacterium]MBT7057105.1 FHA domain-containing protein [Lentisphaerota bacterium]MBT7846172.1 FHA domain-containing protein [Lentisphaerota bacterium]
MPVFRIISSEGDELTRYSTDDHPNVTLIEIGRSSMCQICLKSYPAARVVGRHHLSLAKRPEGWWAMDGGSTGMARNGDPVSESLLTDGARIRFGQCFLVVGDSTQVSGYDLFYETEVGAVTACALWPGRNVIGKSSKSTVTIQDGRGCSRRHAVINVVGASLALEDLGSSNGTRVNGRKLKGQTTVEVGERFELGKVRAWIDRNASAPAYLSHNSWRTDKYFRLFILLVIILVLRALKSAFFPGS